MKTGQKIQSDERQKAHKEVTGGTLRKRGAAAIRVGYTVLGAKLEPSAKVRKRWPGSDCVAPWRGTNDRMGRGLVDCQARGAFTGREGQEKN